VLIYTTNRDENIFTSDIKTIQLIIGRKKTNSVVFMPMSELKPLAWQGKVVIIA
jgi:hypothetical protein